MAIILRDYLHRVYKIQWLSWTGITITLLYFIALIIPVVIETRTHNYWVNTATYFEKPSVNHLQDVLVFIQMEDQTYSFGSTSATNLFFEGTSESAINLSPQFEFLNSDKNNDNKIDSVNVKIQFNADPKKIRSVVILQAVVFSLSTGRINADIKTTISNQFQTPNGFSSLAAQGTLELLQKENFAMGSLQRKIGFEPDLYFSNLIQQNSVQNIVMKEGRIFNSSESSNTTAQFKILNEYSTIVSPPDDSEVKKVQINLIMNVPASTEIRYSPSFLEKLIKFWTQYIALTIPALFILKTVVDRKQYN